MKQGQAERGTVALDGPVKEAYLLLVAAVETAATGDDAAVEATCAKPGVTVTLEAEAIADAERQTGLTFAAPLLLLYSGLSVLDRFNFDLEHLESYAEEATEAGVPETLVPLGRRRRFWVCVDRAAKQLEIVHYKEGAQEPTRQPLAAWFEEVRLEYEHSLVEVHARSEPSREHRRVLEAWSRRASLEVTLRAPVRKGPESLYRVKHAKFGEGFVRREEPSGADTKLEIDFGPSGVKMLLARFVQRIAEG
jgi:hypothetical protein